MCYEGGFSHAPDQLTYGVDMKKIRWCGILQVNFYIFSCCSVLIPKTIITRIAFLAVTYFTLYRELLWHILSWR